VDKYSNFEDLQQHEAEGKDYRRVVKNRTTAIAVIAPHGGRIEPGTATIAKAIAKDRYSLYCFEGLKPQNNKSILHITSTSFDDPAVLCLAEQAETIVAIHGCVGEDRIVYVGGLDIELRDRIIQYLTAADFEAKNAADNKAGRHPLNICNRGLTGKGLQLEVSLGLRKSMFHWNSSKQSVQTKYRFQQFVRTIRKCLEGYSKGEIHATSHPKSENTGI
jgi:phage replication-related protein YjqB (UPF0714/DUF867 family)